ncbi:MAG: DUF4258 domain-containing protein [Thaumarchaeota archaeon]|nr:DUF4258 domain-containing protein [Nitrososphaerota archaeon]
MTWKCGSQKLAIMISDPMRFSRHALEKMRVRVVTKQQVMATINDPDSMYEDAETKLSVAVKKNRENESCRDLYLI